MVHMRAFVVLAFGFAAALAACAGPMGKSEGDQCSSQSDCSSNLTCQPITRSGKTTDVCCPTPPGESGNEACQAM